MSARLEQDRHALFALSITPEELTEVSYNDPLPDDIKHDRIASMVRQRVNELSLDTGTPESLRPLLEEACFAGVEIGMEHKESYE